MKFETTRISVHGSQLVLGDIPIEQYAAIGELQAKASAGEMLSVEIKVKRKGRSKNANALCWDLCTEIAKTMNRHTKVDVYRHAIREVGVVDHCAMPERAVERFISEWGRNGLGWFAERLREAHGLSGCATVAVYYGSSSYDTAEMSRLIDYLVGEALQQGCDVMSASDRALLIDEWRSSDG